MPGWCTTSSDNVEVEVEVEVDLLSLPTTPHLSLPHTRTARTTQLLGLNGLGAWGLGLGLAWSAGDKGGGPLGYESVAVGAGFLGSPLALRPGPARRLNDRPVFYRTFSIKNALPVPVLSADGRRRA